MISLAKARGVVAACSSCCFVWGWYVALTPAELDGLIADLAAPSFRTRETASAMLADLLSEDSGCSDKVARRLGALSGSEGRRCPPGVDSEAARRARLLLEHRNPRTGNLYNRNPVMLRVFQSDTLPHNPEALAAATSQLNQRLDEYLSDKPGMLVAGVGQLYFHMARFPHGGECFTMFLPIMLAHASDEEDDL